MKDKKKASLQEQREIQYNGLLYIKSICKKNNIPYYIISGTLLGAVKYKGYIPWDDDIDIALKRDDYLKLIDLLEKENNGDYEVLTMYNTKDYYYPHAKLVSKTTKLIDNAKEIKKLGVFVDIFPMDCFNDDIEKIFRKTRFVRNLVSKRMRIKASIKKTRLLEEKKQNVKFLYFKKIAYNMIDILSMPLGYNFWVKLLDKFLSKHKEGKYYALLYLDELNYFDVKLFNEFDEYLFEDDMFTSIKDYDFYLRKLYGNYVQDPPLSMQRSHHQLQIYWRNNEK